jgi:hypothetical protein
VACSSLSVKFESHPDLINATVNFAFENQSDQKFLDFCYRDVQLLEHTPRYECDVKIGW